MKCFCCTSWYLWCEKDIQTPKCDELSSMVFAPNTDVAFNIHNIAQHRLVWFPDVAVRKSNPGESSQYSGWNWIGMIRYQTLNERKTSQVYKSSLIYMEMKMLERSVTKRRGCWVSCCFVLVFHLSCTRAYSKWTFLIMETMFWALNGVMVQAWWAFNTDINS